MTIYIVMCVDYTEEWPAAAFYSNKDAKEEVKRLEKIFGHVYIHDVELQ